MIEGTVFNIQRFCVNDGPGIRTTVFLKGCPLRCRWCHNPEGIHSKPEVLYDEKLCIGCGACVPGCSSGAIMAAGYDRTQCHACGTCVTACPTGARDLSGKRMTVSQVLEAVLRDVPFYQTSGGGMTLSGGEPLYQSAFSCALLKQAKNMGLHTCVETSGFAAKQILQEIAAHTDLFLYDWKLTDPNLHRQYTGVSNAKIRENLYLLSSMGKEIILRCPVIPGVNDTSEHFSGIAALANKLDAIRWVELEPYHPLGSGKSAMLGKRAYSFTQPGQDTVARWQDKLSLLTEKEIKIG